MIFLILTDKRGVFLFLINARTSWGPYTSLRTLNFWHLMVICEVLWILHQESFIQIDHLKLLISGRHLLRVMPWMYVTLDWKPFIGFSSNFGCGQTNWHNIFLDLFLAHRLNIDTVKHRHLCGKLFREFNVILLLFAMMIELDRIESLIQVLE